MKSMTVTGPIYENQLGMTLPHEHVIIDLSFLFQESSTAGIADLPVGAVDRRVLCLNPTISKDNLVLGDATLSVRELIAFREAGGSSIVDLTLPGLGRNPRALREISIQSGVHIICGTGWNAELTHPQIVKQASTDDLARVICSELRVGIEGTSIRAGIIGEIGVTGPITRNEEKVLRAAARAQKITGAAMVIDTLPLQEENCIIKALDIIEEEGADLSRTVVAHCDFDSGIDPAYAKSILDRGAYVEFDGFGTERPDYSEWIQQSPKLMLPTDAERVKVVRELTQEGHSRRILLSHDTCMKYEYGTYGGAGYSHLLQRIIPMLKEEGVAENEINAMLVENPRSLLAYFA
jgi:phosphotriesterase-related protein